MGANHTNSWALNYLLHNIKERFGNACDFGLYRDDGLGVTKASPRQAKFIKKELCSIFAMYCLEITIGANKRVVNFLDVTLNRLTVNTCHTTNQETFHSTSTRNLTIHPASSKTSQNPSTEGYLKSLQTKKTFNKATPLYQKALDDS